MTLRFCIQCGGSKFHFVDPIEGQLFCFVEVVQCIDCKQLYRLVFYAFGPRIDMIAVEVHPEGGGMVRVRTREEGDGT